MVEIVNEMRGRFVFVMAGRECVVKGVLTTCNFRVCEDGCECYNGPFTHVNITRFSGTFLRMRPEQIIEFEAIPAGKY
jgi:hypothetical protein